MLRLLLGPILFYCSAALPFPASFQPCWGPDFSSSHAFMPVYLPCSSAGDPLTFRALTSPARCHINAVAPPVVCGCFSPPYRRGELAYLCCMQGHVHSAPPAADVDMADAWSDLPCLAGPGPQFYLPVEEGPVEMDVRAASFLAAQISLAMHMPAKRNSLCHKMAL